MNPEKAIVRGDGVYRDARKERGIAGTHLLDRDLAPSGPNLLIQTIALTSDEEPGRVMAMTLWITERSATHDPRVAAFLVREILSPLIDLVLKVQTCNVDVKSARQFSRGGHKWFTKGLLFIYWTLWMHSLLNFFRDNSPCRVARTGALGSL